MSKKYAGKAAGSNGATLVAQTIPSLDSVLAQYPRHLRSFAASAKDLRLATEAEVRRILDEQPGNQLKAVRVGLQRLLDGKFISAQEQSALTQACKLIFSAQRGQTDPEVAFAKVRAIYDDMLADEKGSPVALSIAGIATTARSAASPVVNLPPGVLAAAATSGQRGDIGMVGGTIGGAVIGGAIGGIPGAIIGGILGGIGAGIAGACSD